MAKTSTKSPNDDVDDRKSVIFRRTSEPSEFGKMRNIKELFDITLVCDGKMFEAHKFVLFACSPYLMEIVKKNRSRHPVFFIMGVKQHILEHILDYMYVGEVTIDQQDIPEFNRVAEGFGIMGSKCANPTIGRTATTSNSEPVLYQRTSEPPEFSKMRNKDVTFVCDGGMFEAHKFVLFACSPYLMTILKKNRSQHPVFLLMGVKQHILEHIIDYMYVGKVRIDQEDTPEFDHVLEELGITESKCASSAIGRTAATSNSKTSIMQDGSHVPVSSTESQQSIDCNVEHTVDGSSSGELPAILPTEDQPDNDRKSNWATWNVRTLTGLGRLRILADALAEARIDVAAVQEAKLLGKGVFRSEKYDFYYSGGEKPEPGRKQERGVGFVMQGEARNAVIGFDAISDRLCTIQLLGRSFNTTIINVYAPTLKYDDETKDVFYEAVQKAYNEAPSLDMKVVLGDFNAKAGREVSFRPTIGPHSLHEKSNKNGSRMINFAKSNEMVVSSTCFPLKNIHKGTWKHLDGYTVNQVDHVMIDEPHSRKILNVKSCRGINIDSDHFLVRLKIRAGICEVEAGNHLTVARYVALPDQHGNDWFDEECRLAVQVKNVAYRKMLGCGCWNAYRAKKAEEKKLFTSKSKEEKKKSQPSQGGLS